MLRDVAFSGGRLLLVGFVAALLLMIGSQIPRAESQDPPVVPFQNCDSDGIGKPYGMCTFDGGITLTGRATLSSLLPTTFNVKSGDALFGGRVGIGTESPAALLHVAGTVLFQNLTDSEQAYRFNDAAGNRLLHIDTVACDIPSDPSTCSSLLDIGAQRTMIQPFTGESDTALLVRTANGFDLLRILTKVGDRRIQIGPGQNGDVQFGVISGSASAVRIDSLTGTNAILAVDAATQRVGIGTATPQETLHVVGDVRLECANHCIAGFSGNDVSPGVVGATIAGGGRADEPNQVTANFSTVSGGVNNKATGESATVGGGQGNTAFGFATTVSGGNGNSTTGFIGATVSGGLNNTASGRLATVGGGGGNEAGSCFGCTVSGGVSTTRPAGRMPRWAGARIT